MRWVRTLFVGLAVFVSLVAVSPPAHAYRNVLSIAPRQQQTPVWCWAAAIEMVFRYHGAPNLNPAGNMQCAIVATRGPACAQNCFNCVVSAGTLHNTVASMNVYRRMSAQANRRFPNVYFSITGLQSFGAIADAIDAREPMIAGISPNAGGRIYPAGMAEHAVVLVGYDDVRRTVIVNDPYPYPPAFNPYARARAAQLGPGRYEVSYQAFVQILGYRDTILIGA